VEPFSPTPGTGEINEDPMFVDPDNHDYHLQEGSPCIGTGMNGEDRGALGYVPTLVDEDILPEVPTRSELAQNHPNPFNATTTIGYELPFGDYVRLEVFDLLGHKVATLAEGEQVAGHKSISWDASQFSSGVYIYRLTVGNLTETKKMMFLK
jgi:hypothetical protein